MNKRWLMLAVTVAAVLVSRAAPARAAVTVAQENGQYVLENEYLRLRINPADGGMVDEYLVKASGTQLVGAGCFMLGDHFWQQLWPGEFLYARYEAKIAAQSAEAVTVEVSRVSTGLGTTAAGQSGIRLTRRMTLTAGSPLLRVEVSLENVSPVGKLAGYWSQSLLFPGGKKEETPVVFRPGVRGVSMSSFDPGSRRFSFSGDEPDSGFVRDPQQGWMAVLGAQSHLGVAFVMRYDELMFLYNCMPYTDEWQYNTVGLPTGKTWKTDFVVYPLAGLPRVDYASRALVAAVEPSDAGGNLQVSLHVAAADMPLTKVTVAPEMIQFRSGKTVPLTAQELAQVGFSPATLTFSAPHDPGEPVVLRFRVTGSSAAGAVEETFETWYGAGMGPNRAVDGTPLHALTTPERHATFLKPDRIEKTHNAHPRVLLCRGPYVQEYLPPSVFSDPQGEVVDSFFSPAATWPALVSYFPAGYEELMALDVIGIINVDTAALGAGQQEMLKDFVTHGGTLVYGGDLWAYSRGHLPGSPLAELLPVSVAGSGKLVALGDAPVEMVAEGRPASPLSRQAVMEYATESFTVKPGARVLLSSQGRPVVVSWTVGEGRVIAITGTALGEAGPGRRLFTRTREWRDWLQRLLGAGADSH